MRWLRVVLQIIVSFSLDKKKKKKRKKERGIVISDPRNIRWEYFNLYVTWRWINLLVVAILAELQVWLIVALSNVWFDMFQRHFRLLTCNIIVWSMIGMFLLHRFDNVSVDSHMIRLNWFESTNRLIWLVVRTGLNYVTHYAGLKLKYVVTSCF
jgi:hypothetical protein